MTIDLCVVSYNNIKELPRFLMVLGESVWKYSYLDWTLHIADNDSTDGTKELLQQFPTDEMITDIFYNENIGYARACNQLAAQGSGEVIALLNADVWLTTQDLHVIEQQFAEHPDMAILGPKQRNERGEITHAGIFGSLEAPKHRGWHEPDPDDSKYRDRVEAVTVSGSAYFIRRSVWDELTQCPVYQEVFPCTEGAFGPFQHYFEETLCSYHASAHGHQVIYDGRISMGHTWHASSIIGGMADAEFAMSQAGFRKFCEAHEIPHD